MILKKFYLKCLSHGSYFLADEASREAAIIDPQRDVEQYLSILTEEGYRLKYILETHVHADFVSGHWDLAEQTGAKVVFGAKALAKKPFLKVRDGDELKLGAAISIHVLETPGHTPESVCYLVHDLKAPDSVPILFSGDTLFVGDVGRPDLLGTKMPASELALLLYNSLEYKIKTLPDETRVYPAHGAGSACGKKIGDAEFTTIGAEKKNNYALQAKDQETFIHLVTSDLPAAPGYFTEDVRLNLEGVRSLKDVVLELKALSIAEVQSAVLEGSMVLDTRSSDEYSSGSIPNAINIGLEGQFSPWLGTLFPPDVSIVLLCEAGTEEEAAIRCGRIGYEKIVGFVAGGFESWKNQGGPVAQFVRLSPSEWSALDLRQPELSTNKKLLPGEDVPILLDVRNPSETEQGVIPGATIIPLNRLNSEMDTLDRNRPIRIYCGSGYRSSIAASILRNRGYKNIQDLSGGMNAYGRAGLPVHYFLESELHKMS